MKITLNQIQNIIKEVIKIEVSDVSEDDIKEIIRKLGPRKFRIYSKKKNKKTGKRKNLGTFSSRAAAKDREKDIAFFKHR